MLPFMSWGKQKESPIKVVPLYLMSDQPVPPVAVPIGSSPSRPSPIHSFVTRMVDYNAFYDSWHDDFIVTEVSNKIWLEINPYDATPIDFDCDIAIIAVSYTHLTLPTKA